MISQEAFDFLEVKPNIPGRYYVTLYSYETLVYVRDYLVFRDDLTWDYGKYKEHYVCFVNPPKE